MIYWDTMVRQVQKIITHTVKHSQFIYLLFNPSTATFIYWTQILSSLSQKLPCTWLQSYTFPSNFCRVSYRTSFQLPNDITSCISGLLWGEFSGHQWILNTQNQWCRALIDCLMLLFAWHLANVSCWIGLYMPSGICMKIPTKIMQKRKKKYSHDEGILRQPHVYLYMYKSHQRLDQPTTNLDRNILRSHQRAS